MTFDLSKFTIDNLRRTVEFIFDDSGLITARRDDDRSADADVLFSLVMQHMSQDEIADVATSAVGRRVHNARRASKVFSTDKPSLMLAIGRKAICGWDMTGRGLRALELQIDWAKAGITDDSVIEFSDINMRTVMGSSNLHPVVMATLDDYDFWFPRDEDQEGNLSSGPSGSMGESPAENVLAPT